MCVWACSRDFVRSSEDNCRGSVLSFYHVGPGTKLRQLCLTSGTLVCWSILTTPQLLLTKVLRHCLENQIAFPSTTCKNSAKQTRNLNHTTKNSKAFRKRQKLHYIGFGCAFSTVPAKQRCQENLRTWEQKTFGHQGLVSHLILYFAGFLCMHPNHVGTTELPSHEEQVLLWTSAKPLRSSACRKLLLSVAQ